MAAVFRIAAIATLLHVAAASIAVAAATCGEALEPRLVHPTDLTMRAGFGIMRHPLLNVDRLHPGIDYPGATDTPIRAAGAGVVEAAAYEGQHGNRIVVRHGTFLRTTYSHLRAFNVTEGQCVEAGFVIGRLGSTGLSAEPHLHFEVHTEAGAVDPVGYLPLR